MAMLQRGPKGVVEELLSPQLKQAPHVAFVQGWAPSVSKIPTGRGTELQASHLKEPPCRLAALCSRSSLMSSSA